MLSTDEQWELRADLYSEIFDGDEECTCVNNGDFCPYCLSLRMDKEDALESEGLI